MPTDDSALILYLLILLVGVGSFFFGDFRNRFSQLFQQVIIWTLIFTTVTILFAYREEFAAQVSPGQVQQEGEAIVLTRARDGHFYATLQINEIDVDFIVDTGATHMVLTQTDAGRIGFDPEALAYLGRANTANGTVRTAGVRLDLVEFGERIDRNIRASVNEGQLETSLLGMTYLNLFQRIEIEQNRLRLVP